MKKAHKSRAAYASYKLYSGAASVYYLLIAYDKKGREIPSSVNCAYNSEYCTEDQILRMAQAL
jgi:hypothetical protein